MLLPAGCSSDLVGLLPIEALTDGTVQRSLAALEHLQAYCLTAST
jgi:hypothetical protein